MKKVNDFANHLEAPQVSKKMLYGSAVFSMVMSDQDCTYSTASLEKASTIFFCKQFPMSTSHLEGKLAIAKQDAFS